MLLGVWDLLDLSPNFSLFLCFLIFFAYPICLFFLTTFFVRCERVIFSFIPIALHVVGAVVPIFWIQPGSRGSPEEIAASYWIPSLIVGIYLPFDWWLARSRYKEWSVWHYPDE